MWQSSEAEITDVEDQSDSGRSSRRWRSVWRIHFYSGMFALPFILIMAITGLVILYTQPIQDLSQNEFRKVSAPESAVHVSLNEQELAVQEAFPDGVVLDVTPPSSQDRSTRFFVDDGSTNGRHVFVNPYTAEVLGNTGPGDGVIGLSNRVHGYLNNDSIKISLPAVAALWDDGPVMRDYVVGDLLLEILGVWTLVLVFSGLFIWWPRKSASTSRRNFFFRRGVKGRARWRDLHGAGGVMLLAFMALTIVSGLGWSTYWAEQFNSLAEKLTPGEYVEQPASALGERGDLDRFGNQIPWATGDFPIPASYAPKTNGTEPAPLNLDDVALIAQEEGMKPGYTISFPVNETDEVGNPIYGSFALYNSWPRKSGEARDVFIDQFSGEKLAEQSVYGQGTIYRGMDYLVSTHMGTQLGIVSRVFMTGLCILSIWSVLSASVMYWKRRRPGTLGLPKRPVDVRLARGVSLIALLMGIVFPQWGITALIVLTLDHFVIQKIPKLRSVFGQVA